MAASAATTERVAPLTNSISASIPLITAIAASGGSRRVNSTEPSSCVAHHMPVAAIWSSASWRVALRNAEASRSICAAVACSAIVTHDTSSCAVATRVIARTFEYDNRPAANAASTTGRAASAWATRTRSIPAGSDNPHFHAIHCAADRHPHVPHP